MKKLKELISDHNGTLSHTKLWSNIANFSATIAFLYSSFKYQLSSDLLVSYVAAVGLQRVASKFLDTKNVKVEDK